MRTCREWRPGASLMKYAFVLVIATIAVCVADAVPSPARVANGELAPPSAVDRAAETESRAMWCAWAERLANPVLTALAKRQLKATMPVEGRDPAERTKSTHLEAFGRLLAGLAPWLELGPDATPEGMTRARIAAEARSALDAATDPQSPDYLNFNQGRQPVVDAAFLAQALLRAPTVLWGKLDPRVQSNVIAALKSTRAIPQSTRNNWVLFSSTIEAALQRLGQTRNDQVLFTGVDSAQKWYLGDGVYGDGPELHWDYYDSYVIHPMLLNILDVVGDETPALRRFKTDETKRAQRYAAIEERLVAPDGSYPGVGRSLVYRSGAFQCLADMAWRRALPRGVHAAQARGALTRVLRRTLEAPGTFDEHGWLRIGLAGHQPSLGEEYISTGSLYLCAEALLPLGLPASDPFWSAPAEPGTWEKLWSGVNLPPDSALRERER